MIYVGVVNNHMTITLMKIPGNPFIPWSGRVKTLRIATKQLCDLIWVDTCDQILLSALKLCNVA